MFRRFSINFALLAIALDSLLVCLMLEVSTRLRPLLGFLPFAAHYPRRIPLSWTVYILSALVWIIVLSLFSVYDGRRNLRTIDTVTSLSLGSILAAMALAGSLYLSYREVSRLLFIVFIILTYFSLLAWRLIERVFFRLYRESMVSRRQVLILGAGEAGQELEQQIMAHPQTGLHVMGFLDDLSSGNHPELLGRLDSLENILESHHPTDVVIALPQQAYEQINQIATILHNKPVRVWLIPDYFRLALHKSAVEEFAGIPLLDLKAPSITEQQRMVKRAFDLVCTTISLPFSLPLMGIIAAAIRIEGTGPILFNQTRLGENGRFFQMYKFRTMYPGSEKERELVELRDEQGRLIHKHADDPRVTRIGKFLRRASLDELAQLINVLKGEMSLVGPRPELPYLVDQYEFWQRKRFTVPQGITGWWQINGRSDRPMHLHTEDDLYYIQHYSLLLDIYILLKTAFVVIQGKGAF